MAQQDNNFKKDQNLNQRQGQAGVRDASQRTTADQSGKWASDNKPSQQQAGTSKQNVQKP